MYIVRIFVTLIFFLVITDIYPKTGSLNGGALLTISGRNFDPTDTKVRAFYDNNAGYVLLEKYLSAFFQIHSFITQCA